MTKEMDVSLKQSASIAKHRGLWQGVGNKVVATETILLRSLESE